MMKDDDFKLLKGFALRRTDERTNERTFVIVESLSRLKNFLDILGGVRGVVCIFFFLKKSKNLEN